MVYEYEYIYIIQLSDRPNLYKVGESRKEIHERLVGGYKGKIKRVIHTQICCYNRKKLKSLDVEDRLKKKCKEIYGKPYKGKEYFICDDPTNLVHLLNESLREIYEEYEGEGSLSFTKCRGYNGLWCRISDDFRIMYGLDENGGIYVCVDGKKVNTGKLTSHSDAQQFIKNLSSATYKNDKKYSIFCKSIDRGTWKYTAEINGCNIMYSHSTSGGIDVSVGDKKYKVYMSSHNDIQSFALEKILVA